MKTDGQDLSLAVAVVVTVEVGVAVRCVWWTSLEFQLPIGDYILDDFPAIR